MRAIKINLPVRQAGTRNIAILFFSLVLTLAVFSQLNASVKPKPTSDVGFAATLSEWLYSKTNNDLSAYLGKKSSTLPTVRYQKGGDYLEFSMDKVSLSSSSRYKDESEAQAISSTASVSLETDSKNPNNPILFYRNILEDADVNYQITKNPFKVKEEIILKKNPSS